VGISQYKVLGALDESMESDSYRPFDARSRGLVVGEGAGFLLLEELEHAKKRGAAIYAEITGFGSSFSGGRQIAMQSAMKEAGVKVSDIRYLQAAGLGLKEEDEAEAQAIFDVFNGSGKNLYVSASKSITGFTGFSAGALDLILSTLALKNQTIPPVAHFSDAGRDWGFQIVKGPALRHAIPYAMTNAFGFNGQAVSVVTKTYPGDR
jgi:3-oxoacyl-[acyl-carrier-protein] synthase II